MSHGGRFRRYARELRNAHRARRDTVGFSKERNRKIGVKNEPPNPTRATRPPRSKSYGARPPCLSLWASGYCAPPKSDGPPNHPPPPPTKKTARRKKRGVYPPVGGACRNNPLPPGDMSGARLQIFLKRSAYFPHRRTPPPRRYILRLRRRPPPNAAVL